MNRNHDFEDYFLMGVISTFLLLLAGTLTFFAVTQFKSFLIALGVLISIPAVLFGVGWLVLNIQDEYKKWKEDDNQKDYPSATPYTIDVPVIDGLRRLEHKYNMDTLTFICFASGNGKLFGKIDNLDYIEWLGLVNELPTLKISELEEVEK